MATSAEFAQKVRERGSLYYDAPVSGGTMGAEKGTLTFMMGIEEQDPNYPLVRAVCSMMGTNLFPCGGPTLGLASKLTNNYVSGLIAIATSEGMNLGMRLGLDPKILSAVFSTSTAQSWVNGNYHFFTNSSFAWKRGASSSDYRYLDKCNVNLF